MSEIIDLKEIKKIGYGSESSNLEWNTIEWSEDHWIKFEKDSTRWYGPLKLDHEAIQHLLAKFKSISRKLGIDLTRIDNIEKVNVQKLVEMIATKDGDVFRAKDGRVFRII